MNKYMLRGGSWCNNRVNARCAARVKNLSHDGNYNLGFRVVRQKTLPRKIVRGGSWYSLQDYAGASVRFVNRPGLWLDSRGFRIVKDAHNE